MNKGSGGYIHDNPTKKRGMVCTVVVRRVTTFLLSRVDGKRISDSQGGGG